MIGETVGSYRIVSKLSVGGMGTIYKAEHTLIGKQAAVKTLHSELCTNEELVQRFFNEAKATTTIKHPGIVEVFDYGVMPSGIAYLTMEFLEGMSLAHRMSARGAMSEGEATMLLRGVCSALAAAHAKGIVHRDLKPDNIFLTPDPDAATGERPKLLDFGIAKLTDVGRAGTATKTGAVMGTPTYMSPEQCRGTGDVDARADLYSIGCIFYELVTGSPPFTDEGAGELIGAHLYVDPEPPTTIKPDLHPETTKLIMALLRKKPAERPQSAKELGQRLTDLAHKLGWITAGSPNGVTAPVLADLATRTAAADSSGSVAVDSATPVHAPDGPVATASSSLTFDDDAPLATQKPTTLSSAASQVDLPRRSRKGLGLAMLAAAALAGGAVAAVKLRQGDGKQAKAAVKAPNVEAPMPEPKPEPKPEPPPPPDDPDPIAAEPLQTTPDPPPAIKPDPAHDKLAQERQRERERRRQAIKREVKPPKKDPPKQDPPKRDPKPEPKKDPPKTNPLIEREL